MAGQVVELTDENFNEVIGNGVVLVDFFADWCGPCKVIAPVIEELAKELNGKAVVAKADVGNAEKATEEFQITAVPTLIIFKQGKEVQRFNGITMKSQLLDSLQKQL